MGKCIEASRDLETLAKVLPLYIEQAASQSASALAARRKALRRQATVNPERQERLEAAPEVPHAFELWIGHLGFLDQLSGGVQFTLDDLTPEEARGLALLRRAREKFWQEHISCPVCQSVNLRNSSFCGGCGKEFGGNG